MRPSSYWPLAVLIGAVVASGVFVLVSDLAFAGSTAIVYVLAAGSSFRTAFAFRKRFESGGPSTETLFWSGLISVTASVVTLLFGVLVPLPFGQGVAIVVVVLGAMIVMLNAGMGMTLAHANAADDARNGTTESAMAD